MPFRTTRIALLAWIAVVSLSGGCDAAGSLSYDRDPAISNDPGNGDGAGSSSIGNSPATHEPSETSETENPPDTAVEQPEPPETPRRPNIVIILTDDQGYGDVSYHQHPREVSTPSIDTIAADGVRMTNGYANCSVCAPSRASLLTGRYSQRFGFYDANDSRVGMPVDEVTIADLLKQNGYQTGIFGKWHCGLDKQKHHPCNRGFDSFYGFLGHGGHDYFDLDYDRDNEHNAIWTGLEIARNESGYLTDILGDKAVSFIEENKNRPFFLYLPFNAVHSPLQAPNRDVDRFDTGDEDRDTYLAMLYRLDLAIGRVLDKLKETGNYGNTLMFFFSDNGGSKSADNMPLRGGKHSFYEGGIRVPFLVSWPSRLQSGDNHIPVLGMDIFATVCSVAGITPPQDNKMRDGKDMMPVLTGVSSEPLHEYMYWYRHDDAGDWAIRHGRWKLHRNREGDVTLVDLDEDLEEQEDVSNKHSDIAANLKNKYTEWRNSLPAKLND